jgi:hypothetical protein
MSGTAELAASVKLRLRVKGAPSVIRAASPRGDGIGKFALREPDDVDSILEILALRLFS